MKEDDDEGSGETKVDDIMKNDKNEKCGVEKKNSKKEPSKNDEPKIDLRTLPFLQRFIMHNLDKQIGKFLNHLKDITITIPFMDAIRDLPT